MRAGTPLRPHGSAPSDEMLTGVLDGVELVFLPRHGRGHVHSPTSVPYRANIDALKRLGVTDVISVSACGSFRDEMAPGDFVIVDQFIDPPLRGRSRFLGPAVWPMSALPILPARVWAMPARQRRRDVSISVHRGPIWRWRVRSFRPWRKASSIGKSGAVMLLA